MANQIEGFATRSCQLQGIPTRPDDEVGLPARFGQEALQYRHPGVIPLADTDFARCGRASIERLRSVFVGQFKMRKPAAAKIEHAMDPPIGAFAGGLADTGAIRQGNMRPGQRSLAPGAFAISRRASRAARKPTACFSW